MFLANENFPGPSTIILRKNGFIIKTDIEHGLGLRVPQVGALYALLAHWTISSEAGIIVLPTGTGKTDTMLAALISNKFPSLRNGYRCC